MANGKALRNPIGIGVLADAMAVLWTVAIDEEMQKTVEAGVLAKRAMFKEIVHEENKLMFQRLVEYFSSIKVAVDKVGHRGRMMRVRQAPQFRLWLQL